MKTYDVVIVGAGPAGAVAGFLCAGSGLETLIIEKKRLPRPKICGGGVSARSVELLKQIQCYESSWFESFVHCLRIHLPKVKQQHELMAEAPFMGVVDRGAFDQALADKAVAAGAVLRPDEAFQRFRRKTDQRIEIITDQSVFQTSFLIGADGYASRVRRQLENEASERRRSLSGLLGIAGDLPAAGVDMLSNRCCHLFFNFAPGVCYGWVFPKGSFLNVGLLFNTAGRSRPGTAASPQAIFEDFVENMINAPVPFQRWGGAMLPYGKWRRKPLLEHANVLLAGDAAGFTDAWSGEGIYYALKSACYAHRSISQYLAAGREGRGDYLQRCCREILPELNLSYLFSRFFKRFPGAYHLLACEGIRRLFLPYVRGELGYGRAFFKAFAFGIGYESNLFRSAGQ